MSSFPPPPAYPADPNGPNGPHGPVIGGYLSESWTPTAYGYGTPVASTDIYRPPGPLVPVGRFATFGPYQWPALKNAGGLGRAVTVLLMISALTDVFDIVARFRRLDVIYRFERGDTFGLVDDASAADRLVTAAGALWSVAFVVTAIVFVVWFYRVRFNAGCYGTYEQRRGQGWSIGAWFTPILSWFYPFQMTTDIMLASQSDTEERRYSSPIVNAWWIVWIVSTSVFWLVGRLFVRPANLGEFKARDIIGVLDSLTDIAAAVLLILVVRQIGAAQARWEARLRPLG